LFTISSNRRVETIDYGVLEIDGRGRLVGFKEKPKTEFDVSMGVYMVNRDVLAMVPSGKPYGFDTLMLEMLASGRGVVVQDFAGYWLDIGRPDDYTQAIEDFERMRARLLRE
jgi:NDP-sugar pyrophosphorylase family protein